MPKETWQKRNFDCDFCGESPIEVFTAESGDWIGDGEEVRCPGCRSTGHISTDPESGPWVNWLFDENGF